MPRPRPLSDLIQKKKINKKKQNNPGPQPPAPACQPRPPMPVAPPFGVGDSFFFLILNFFFLLISLYLATRVQLTSAEANQKGKEPPGQGLAPLQSGKIIRTLHQDMDPYVC
jgi:hypothetical protein